MRRFLVLALCLMAASLHAAVPKVSPRANGTAELHIEGAPGNVVTVEATRRLALDEWDLISAQRLTNDSLTLVDSWAQSAPSRFYRITESAGGLVPVAPNFRLLDQNGRSRELHYFREATNINAFALVFTDTGCEQLELQLPAIQALRQKYETRGVTFWMIDSQSAETRSNIVAAAARLGINFPILHDRAQTTARLYKTTHSPEIVLVERGTFGVFYRGALLEHSTAPDESEPRNFADEALDQFLQGNDPALLRTKPGGCDLPLATAPSLDYSTVIAPLLQQKCVICHSPGNVAPWAMTNHTIVQAYGPAILRQVSARQMPPWHADPEFGRFENDISLSPEQEQALIQWIAAGAPRGNGPDPLEEIPPPPSKWPAELGEPDLILKTPLQQISAEGVEPYRYIFVPTGLTNDAWLKAAVVRPSNTRVVHHYLVWEGESMSQMAAGITGYVPGMRPRAFPEGTGTLLRQGTSLTFNLHYTPSGQPETDQPELGLWFHQTRPAKEIQTLPLPASFVIPPGVMDHEVVTTLPVPLPFNATVYSLAPHMHLRGSRMRFEIIYPDQTRDTLLSVPKYDFHWQTRYVLAEPKRIPAGTRVIVTGAFDNSHLNHANPDPTQTVYWGEQSWDEMFLAYFEFTQD